jgi:tetratricopeptide (TPR) repeat protein
MSKAKRKRERGQAAAAARPAWNRWYLPGAAFGVLVVLFLIYGPALRGPFVFDDPYLPFNDEQASHMSLYQWMRGQRPFLMASFWLNLRLSGLEPYSYHLVNILLHFLTGGFVFFIVRKLVERAGETGPIRDTLAAFSALLFLFHPLQTESVAYIASRSETLSVMFFYAAFAVFLSGAALRPAQDGSPPGMSWLRSGAVLALFGCAASTKEHTAVLPALLLLTDYYFNPGFSFAGIRRNWRLYGLLTAAAGIAVYFVARVLRAANTAGFSIKEFDWLQYFFTQCRAVWLYLRLFFFPYGQNVDHDFAISRSVFDHGAIIAFVALVALVAAALWYRRRYPLASYGILTFLLLLSPTSSFIPILDPTAEHRLYLPALGLLLVVAEFLRRWKTTRPKMMATMAGVLVVIAVLTYNRSQVWSSDVALWQDAISKSPYKSRPHFQLGFAWFAQGQCQAALPEFDKAGRYAKPDYRLLVDWGLVNDCVGNRPEAIHKLKQAAALSPTAHVYSLIGMVYGRQGLRAEALDALNTAARIDPRFEMTYVYRAALYSEQNNLDAAAAEYRRALTINPGNDLARQGLTAIEQKLNANRR